MLAICLNCGNNKAAEQLNVQSFSSLPILGETLFDFQIKNLFDLGIEEIYVIDEHQTGSFKEQSFQIKQGTVRGLYKELLDRSDSDDVFIFKNNFYFDCSFKEILEGHTSNNSDITFITNGNDNIFAAFYSVGAAKREIAFSGDAEELFNSSLSDNIKCISGYFKEILSAKEYMNILFDLINLNTPYKPTFVAENVFTDEEIPNGDFIIIPPVWFGGRIQIESGAVIGPNAVIMDETLISKNTRIKNSVLMKDVYVSSECYIDGALCCNSVVIKRGAAIFKNSILGSSCVIGEDSIIESDSVVRTGVHINNYVKSPFCSDFYEYDTVGGFQGLTPEKASLLGSSIGYVYNKSKICIGSDGEPNSQALRFSLIGGLISTGAEVVDIGHGYESFVLFCSEYCELDMSIYISGRGGGTRIDVYEKRVKPMGKSGYYNVLSAVKNETIPCCKADECKGVRQIKGLAKMYVREIINLFSSELRFCVKISSENEYISAFLSEIFKKIGREFKDEPKIHFIINYSGDRVTAETNGKTISHRTLESLVSFFENSANDEYKKFLNSFWRFDAVFLTFKVISILNETGYKVGDIIKQIPRFYIEEKILESPLKPGIAAEKIEDFSLKKDDIFLTNNADIKIKKGHKSNELKIIAKALSVEFAKELVDEVEHILKT